MPNYHTLGFDIGPLAQYLARRILEIMLAGYPLLNCFVRDEAVIALHKVFVHSSDRCARLGSCLSGCFFQKREAFILACARYISRSRLDLHSLPQPVCNSHMDITPSSPRIPPWQIFVLSFCTGCAVACTFCILIYHARSFPTELIIIGPSDTQSVASAHATKYSLWFARIVQQCSSCYFTKMHGLTTSSYYTSRITVLGYHADAPDTLRQSF